MPPKFRLRIEEGKSPLIFDEKKVPPAHIASKIEMARGRKFTYAQITDEVGRGSIPEGDVDRRVREMGGRKIGRRLWFVPPHN